MIRWNCRAWIKVTVNRGWALEKREVRFSKVCGFLKAVVRFSRLKQLTVKKSFFQLEKRKTSILLGFVVVLLVFVRCMLYIECVLIWVYDTQFCVRDKRTHESRYTTSASHKISDRDYRCIFRNRALVCFNSFQSEKEWKERKDGVWNLHPNESSFSLHFIIPDNDLSGSPVSTLPWMFGSS